MGLANYRRSVSIEQEGQRLLDRQPCKLKKPMQTLSPPVSILLSVRKRPCCHVIASVQS